MSTLSNFNTFMSFFALYLFLFLAKINTFPKIYEDANLIKFIPLLDDWQYNF
jgi:hypothetical protein